MGIYNKYFTEEFRKEYIMDYAHTYPNETIRYHASEMCLHIDSDAAYLVHPQARSRVAGHFYLSDKILLETPTPNPTPHRPILKKCRTVCNVMSSAAEAKTIGIFHNANVAVPIQKALTELNHPQPPATIRSNNSTSHGILTSTIRKKLSKAFDMNIYWVKDRIKRKQFFLFWDIVTNNKADYFTKHLPPKYHKQIRPTYLHRPSNHLMCSTKALVQGCVNPNSYMPHKPIH